MVEVRAARQFSFTFFAPLARPTTVPLLTGLTTFGFEVSLMTCFGAISA